VTDANDCEADFVLEIPFPKWCLMDNESSSSSPRDYWTLPDGMLPWLIAVGALVAVFLVAAFIACCAWSCLSERSPSEPKQKLLEQGKPASPDLSNAKVHDYDAGKGDAEKEEEPEEQQHPEEQEEQAEKQHPEQVLTPVQEEEAGDKDKTPEKKKKKKKKGDKKKKDAEKEGEVETGMLDEHALASGEEEEDKTTEKKKKKKKSKSKKHKALEDDEGGPQIELEEMQ